MSIKETIFISLFIFLKGLLIGQCPFGSIHLKTQADIDSFPIKYPNCTRLKSELVIGATDKVIIYPADFQETNISNLLPLNQIKSIKGRLYINLNPRLKDLAGLENLDSIVQLHVFYNDSLKNMDNLNAFYILDIRLSRLKMLESVNGFINLKEANNLLLGWLPALRSFSGFSNITKLNELGLIELNMDLTGFEKLESIKVNLQIIHCPNIRDFKKMTSFKGTILDRLSLDQDTMNFSTAGLESLTEIGRLDLGSNKNTSNLIYDLNGLVNVKRIKSFGGNADLRPMINLDTIDYYYIYKVDTVDGHLLLDNLPCIKELSIRDNLALEDISFLSKVQKIKNYLNIRFNPKLDFCNYKVICDYIEKGTNFIEIHDNGPNCSDAFSIYDQCKEEAIGTTLLSHAWHEVVRDFQSNIKSEYTLTMSPFSLGVSSIQIENHIGATHITDEKLYENNHRVYLGQNANNKLMYDFSKELGDTITSKLWPSPLVVSSVGQFTLENGEQRKSMTLHCANDENGSKYGYRSWIEGIGDTKGLYSIVYACSPYPKSELICFLKNGERLYQSENYLDCTLTSNEDLNEKDIVVLPNPVKEMVQIIPNEDIASIHVYGIEGRLEYTSHKAQEYDLSNLRAGLKIVKVKFRNNEVKWVKLVKI